MPRPAGGTRPATRRGGRDAPPQCTAGDARRRELGVGKLASMQARAQDQRSLSPIWIVGGGCWPVRRLAAAPADREAGNLKVMHVAAIAVLVGIIVAPGDL
jgi:hypothetical protein